MPEYPETPMMTHIAQCMQYALDADIDFDLLIALDMLETPDPTESLANRELTALLKLCDFHELTLIALNAEICPIHRCDPEICIDDQIHA
jgi:hypothetical protein